MTAELVRGQNHPLPNTRLEIRVSAGSPVVAAAALGDEQGRIRGAEWVARPGAPALPGLEVSQQAAADHRLAVDPGALPGTAHRVNILLALPPAVGALGFGALAAPRVAVAGPDGTEIAGFTITGLGSESAVVAVELYRRQGAWKLRAVGQGYAGGLVDLLRDHGLSGAAELAAAMEEAVTRGAARTVAPPAPAVVGGPTVSGSGTAASRSPAGGPVDYRHPRRGLASQEAAAPSQERPTGPVAGDAGGWSMEERLYNQVWGMFEDMARTTAAYRSALDFADSRFERELDHLLAERTARISASGDAARSAAGAKRADLIARARAVLDRDMAQLAAESEVVEPALPAPYARWDSPVWHGYRVPSEEPFAARIGDLHLLENPDLRIPLLVRLPLERGLWIDSGRTPGTPAAVDSDEVRRLAMEVAVALAARLLASYPAGRFSLQVIDPGGTAAAALGPLTRSGALRQPPAAGVAGVAAALAGMTRRVDLVQMAVRAGAPESLPPDVDTAEQLLIVNDFPHGFDDRAVTQLRYLADEGPSVGVHLLLVASREDAQEYGPVLDPFWRSLMRLTPTADDHLADPWVGHAWTYEPLLAPQGSGIVPQVLRQIVGARPPGAAP